MSGKHKTENELRIISAISISDYYNSKVSPLDRKFRPMKGEKPSSICPFHEDTDPSFHYWKEKQVFRCFGCFEVGDVIKMHQLIQKNYHNRGISRDQSMKELASEYNIELEYQEDGELSKPTAIEMAKRKLSDTSQYKNIKLKDMNSMSIANYRYFHNQIKNNTAIDETRKINSYHRLDIMLSAHLMKTK